MALDFSRAHVSGPLPGNVGAGTGGCCHQLHGLGRADSAHVRQFRQLPEATRGSHVCHSIEKYGVLRGRDGPHLHGPGSLLRIDDEPEAAGDHAVSHGLLPACRLFDSGRSAGMVLDLLKGFRSAQLLAAASGYRAPGLA